MSVVKGFVDIYNLPVRFSTANMSAEYRNEPAILLTGEDAERFERGHCIWCGAYGGNKHYPDCCNYTKKKAAAERGK